MADLIQPTADEAYNGWTAESLTAYLEQAQADEERNHEAHLSGPLKKDGTRRRQWPPQRTAVKDWDPLRR